MSWDAFIDPISSFLGQDAETQVGNLRQNLDGQYKPTMMDNFWGRANDGQATLDTAENTATRRKYKPLLESVGKRWTDGMSSGAAAEMYQTGKEEKSRSLTAQINNDRFMSPQQVAERQKRDRQYNDSRTDVANQMALTRAEMAQGNARFNATMQRQMANDAKSHQLQLMQFADAREQKANNLEYQKMRDRRADIQYNERLEQLDRKDRRMAMSSIAAGLASLGAAFAA